MTISCACVRVEYDGDGWEFGHGGRVTAEKGYKCTECGKDILPGEIYESFRGKADSCWYTERTCPVCLNIRDVLFCNGWQFEGLYQSLEYHIDEKGGVDEACLAALTPKAREKVCEMIEECWERYFGEEDEP
jgi:hypothetical protein